MCKPSNSKALGLGLAWACISLCATAQGATVAEVIARMKQQREQESLGASPSGAVPKASKKVGIGKLPTAPLLWSIIGANDDIQAVLVYQGKAYVAQAHMPRTQMGPWWIESISANGVVLSLQTHPKATPLVLPAPERGAAIEPYALGLGVYRSQASTAVTGSAQLPAARASSAQSALWTATDTEPLVLGTTPSDPQGGPLPASAARIALPPDPNLGLVPKRP
jgi:hypothetical protein